MPDGNIATLANVLDPDDTPTADFSPQGAGEVERMIEALLFAAAEPLSVKDLASRMPDGADIAAGLAALVEQYATRGVNLVEVAGRWRFQTADDLAFLMTLEREEPRRLSRAAQETLAIVAYHQPVTRAEIEAIRGVQASRGTLDLLLEIGFVRPRGRRRTPGRPVTYATTDAFLEHFGLASLADLPGAAEMKAAGLLDLDLPPDFAVPDPSVAASDDEALEDEAPGEFHTDYLGPETPET